MPLMLWVSMVSGAKVMQGGYGWVDEAMRGDVEVCVYEGVVEHVVGDEEHWLVNDFVNVFGKIFNGVKKGVGH